MTYLKSDVPRLADVFEDFRKTCMEYCKFDPASYITAPGLAWDAMFEVVEYQIRSITDINMLDIIERPKRGGLCVVGSNRVAKSNNKCQADYDPTKESTNLIYLDANNLYGWAMSQ